jgi:hypothetical protein
VLFCEVWKIGQNDCGDLVCIIQVAFRLIWFSCLTDEPWSVWRIISLANWSLLLLYTSDLRHGTYVHSISPSD